MKRGTSSGVLKRIAAYLSYLRSLPENDETRMSAKRIAAFMCLGEVQVRKDLATATYPGSAKIGRSKKEMIHSLEQYLHLDCKRKTIYIGMGELMPWIERNCGDYLDISARFRPYARPNGSVISLSKCRAYCRENEIELAIIDVTEKEMDRVLTVLEGSGIKMIWNFSPVLVPNQEGICIRNEDILGSLGVLSFSAIAEQDVPIKD